MNDTQYGRALRKACPALYSSNSDDPNGFNGSAFVLRMEAFKSYRNFIERSTLPLDYVIKYVRMEVLEFARYNNELIEFHLL